MTPYNPKPITMRKCKLLRRRRLNRTDYFSRYMVTGWRRWAL
jgi:hypothetical protein